MDNYQGESVMKKLIALALMLGCGVAQGALEGRLPVAPGGTDYQAYYDSDLGITWLADANYAATEDFGITGVNPNGTMDWHEADDWVTAMNNAEYLGVSIWRLPEARPVDGSDEHNVLNPYYPNESATVFNGEADVWWNISATGTLYEGSGAHEMSHLFYQTLGLTGTYNTDGSQSGCQSDCLTDTGPFANLMPDDYWYGTLYPIVNDDENAFAHEFNLGRDAGFQTYTDKYVMAVADGDVFSSVVPIPAAVWLFGSGLGLLGWFRRRQS